MSLEYDFFGNSATFSGQQAVVVEAMSKSYVEIFSRNVQLEIERDDLAERLKVAESELQEVQKLIDVSISRLDPDAQ